LEIWHRTEVARILFEQGRATGVEAVRDGHSQRLTLKQCRAAAQLADNFTQPTGRGPWLLAKSFRSDHTD
jgi:hypothetical protein